MGHTLIQMVHIMRNTQAVMIYTGLCVLLVLSHIECENSKSRVTFISAEVSEFLN